MEDFKEKLEILINKHSMENGSNTPDYILAEYLVNCLKAFNQSMEEREHYYGEFIDPNKTEILDNKN